MRLINTTSLEIVEFFDNDVPKYAILSHTWGDGDTEVSLSDFRRGDPLTKAKSGYQKIENACREALKHSLHYVWVDTCCIDKTSSAELSEAINSMFRWYEEAEICFAYLVDATSAAAFEPSGASRWFTRGWTLQELLAPSNLDFFDRDWVFIANRQDAAEAISLTTGIDQEFLTDTYFESRRKLLAFASGATKMSWATRRTTTRKEDIAYCLLGIFDVNMPLIYGEGVRAFTRLQQEILRNSFDPTLLAWNHTDLPQLAPELEANTIWSTVLDLVLGCIHPWRAWLQSPAGESPVGLLASSPADFLYCKNITAYKTTSDWNFKSQGLEVTLPTSEDVTPYAMIPCHLEENPTRLLALPLRRSATGVYSRSDKQLGVFSHETWQRWPKKRIMLRLTTSEDSRTPGNHDNDLMQSRLWIRSIPSSFTMVDAYCDRPRCFRKNAVRIQPDHLRKGNLVPTLSRFRHGESLAMALVLEDSTSGTAFAILMKAVPNSSLLSPGMMNSERLVCRYMESVSRTQLIQQLQSRSPPLYSLPIVLCHKDFVYLCSRQVSILGQKTWVLDFKLSKQDRRSWVFRCTQWFRKLLKWSDSYFTSSKHQALGRICSSLIRVGLVLLRSYLSAAMAFVTTVTLLVLWAWNATTSFREDYVCALCCPSLCSTEWKSVLVTVVIRPLYLLDAFLFANTLLPMVSYPFPGASDFIRAHRLIFASIFCFSTCFCTQMLNAIGIGDLEVVFVSCAFGSLYLTRLIVMSQEVRGPFSLLEVDPRNLERVGSSVL